MTVPIAPALPSPEEELAPIPEGPWDRRPGESSKAYWALMRYLRLGPERSYARLVAQYRYNEASLHRWAKEHGWKDRAIAYDDCMNREIMARLRNGMAEMCERHIEESQTLQSRAMDRLAALPVEALSPSDVVRFMDTAIRIERQSRGAVDQPNINITAASNEQFIEAADNQVRVVFNTVDGELFRVLVDVVLDTIEDPDLRERVAERMRAAMSKTTSPYSK